MESSREEKRKEKHSMERIERKGQKTRKKEILLPSEAETVSRGAARSTS
jgi:hypothetical protein